MWLRRTAIIPIISFRRSTSKLSNVGNNKVLKKEKERKKQTDILESETSNESKINTTIIDMEKPEIQESFTLEKFEEAIMEEKGDDESRYFKTDDQLREESIIRGLFLFFFMQIFLILKPY